MENFRKGEEREYLKAWNGEQEGARISKRQEKEKRQPRQPQKMPCFTVFLVVLGLILG